MAGLPEFDVSPVQSTRGIHHFRQIQENDQVTLFSGKKNRTSLANSGGPSQPPRVRASSRILISRFAARRIISNFGRLLGFERRTNVIVVFIKAGFGKIPSETLS